MRHAAASEAAMTRRTCIDFPSNPDEESYPYTLDPEEHFQMSLLKLSTRKCDSKLILRRMQLKDLGANLIVMASEFLQFGRDYIPWL